MVEEGDVVFATGRLSVQRTDGCTMRAAIAELFAFCGDLIARREAWVVPLPEEEPRSRAGGCPG